MSMGYTPERLNQDQSEIILCVHCGQKNRITERSLIKYRGKGYPNCGKCKKSLDAAKEAKFFYMGMFPCWVVTVVSLLVSTSLDGGSARSFFNFLFMSTGLLGCLSGMLYMFFRFYVNWKTYWYESGKRSSPTISDFFMSIPLMITVISIIIFVIISFNIIYDEFFVPLG